MSMTFRTTVLTLYPEMFPGPLGVSLAGKALDAGAWSLEARNIRDHGSGGHRAVDDTPAGGGAGMVLRPDVMGKAIRFAGRGERHERGSTGSSGRTCPGDETVQSYPLHRYGQSGCKG